MKNDRQYEVIILAYKKLSHHTRVVRQARSLHDAGYTITIVSNEEEDLPNYETTEYYQHFRIKPHIAAGRSRIAVVIRKIRKRHMKLGNELAYIYNVFTALKGRKARLYHIHDSYPLVVGYILAKLHRAKLVYDGVELAFDKGRPAAKDKGRVRLWLEKFVIRRADALLATGDGHAEAIASYYKVDKPTILMNCKEFKPLSALKTPDPAKPKVILYSGSVTRDYGLYSLIKASTYIDNTITLIIGPENIRGYKNELMVLIKWLGAQDRVFLLNPVSRDEVISLIAPGNVGVIPPPQNIPNYSYALPNKFFDYIMARLPIVTYAAPDMKRIVESHDIGIVLNQDSPEAIAEAIRNVLGKEEYYRSNLDNIASWYSWEIESTKMIEVYKQLLR